MLGFDAEDFHSGEGTGGPTEALPHGDGANRRGRLLAVLCAHDGRGAADRRGLRVALRRLRPTTVLNVFPARHGATAASGHRGEPASEAAPCEPTGSRRPIGLDRGLQAFLQAMARTNDAVDLDIRGGDRSGPWRSAAGAGARLGRCRAREAAADGAAGRDGATWRRAYDIGLSLETDASENRRLCLTNKIFTYLLAGVPVMMSDTPAQSALAPDLGEAAALVSLADPDAMAASARSPCRLARSARRGQGRGIAARPASATTGTSKRGAARFGRRVFAQGGRA